ncbi:DUF1269 domain-containing protein [Gulosibacter molinativorax]|uniref:DUF1269 domain-containing protein n=1 Tax=Gulosibacter molinativorax TaxID=256821 RepID=A0ABT7C8Y1_9MICO|nr:DUF1269 domain-containing protein [Gulosibacter molinativorax]MDJ1371187.1 DUF1269 domain-containing protein [Gulosibacter molinativorax]QUY63002.1 Membrane protein [Gulosibacter molinativorax]
MTETNIIVASFTEESKAYQALSDLKGAGLEGRVNVRTAVLVNRDEEGRLSIPEGEDAVGGTGTWAGSLTGLLLGVLGGPIGMLFGWGGGALVGGAFDARRADRGETVLDQLSQSIPNGGTVVIAEVEEFAVGVVNELVAELGGVVYRRPVEEVLGELEAAEDAYEQGRQEANRIAREERRAERKENFEQRKENLKQKLGIAD